MGHDNETQIQIGVIPNLLIQIGKNTIYWIIIFCDIYSNKLH